MVDESGQVRSFSSFKAEAQKVGNIFNKNWLKTEYQHAIAASQSASNWESFKLTKKALPLLQYDTAQDDRVRPEHAALQGVTKPINDSFWNSFYPPNGFGCRCGVRQLADGDVTPNEKINYPDEKGVPPSFRTNVGKTGEAFPKDLPFFKTPIGLVPMVQNEIKAAQNNANN